VDRERAAREAAEQFIAAIVSGDAAAITALMTPKAQDELLQSMRRWGVSVATVQDAAARVWNPRWTALFADVRVDSVEIEGGHATVTYSHPEYGRDDDDAFSLAEIDGRWLLDEFLDDYDDDSPPVWSFPT
jgi:hypothetical protein